VAVILATVPPSVSHVLDLGFVEVRKLVLLDLRIESKFVDVVNDLPQVVTALDAVFNLAEDLTNLIFDGIWAGGTLFKTHQVWEQLAVDELSQVVAGLGLFVVNLVVFAFGGGPAFPSVWLAQDVIVLLSRKRRPGGFFRFECIKIFQEE